MYIPLWDADVLSLTQRDLDRNSQSRAISVSQRAECLCNSMHKPWAQFPALRKSNRMAPKIHENSPRVRQ